MWKAFGLLMSSEPKFRANTDNLQTLHEVANTLANNEEYAMPAAGLKYNAISELIRRHMMERNGKASDSLLSDLSSSMEEAAEQSDGSSICSSITSTGTDTSKNTSPTAYSLLKYSPPLKLDDKLHKVASYKDQFKKGKEYWL